MAEGLSESCNQFWGGGVMVHWKNGWPVSVGFTAGMIIINITKMTSDVNINSES